MSQLYEIAGRYRELASLDADDEAIANTLQGIECEFEEKAQRVVHVSLNLQSDVEAIDNEIERLKQRKAAILNHDARLREYLRTNMEATGITNISCPLFSITLAKGREIAVIDDANKLPDELVRVKTEIAPDKNAIAAKLKLGENVPGAHLERGQSSIRIK